MDTVSKSFNLSQNALKVLQKRYLKKDEEGKVIETPEELFRRIAKAVASADLNYTKDYSEVQVIEEEFYNCMTSVDFLPNSPTLMNAGRRLGQLSACFVLPVGDSMESIFDAVKNAAIIHKSGGGTGFSFSNLRPNGDVVGSTKGISSGPISFMTVFDTATEAVKQGGTRRGANMGILRVDHPDILEFITCKDNTQRLTNFNISVALTEEFMNAVDADREYNLINPRTKLITKRLGARETYNLIVKHAWQNGEPGIVFIDRINMTNPTPHLGSIESTNPCGEQPLLAFESCNLGSINLAKMIKEVEQSQTREDGKSVSGIYDVDWEKLRETTWKAVHFLDNVIDVNKYPLEQIAENTKANRKIGLGVMGWADMLIHMGIPYNSDMALTLAEEVMSFIQEEGKKASESLAAERGTFPNYWGSTYDGKRKLRNATITTIAPTGSLSILAGCSSGIEPLFAVSFVRNVLEGTKLIEANPHFEKVAKEKGFWSRQLMEKISEKNSLRDIDEIPEDIKRIFVTAHDITPEDHIRMQAAFQNFVDNAVSKTVNFPKNATVDDVDSVYRLAYKLNCKGVTVYRDGSREEQVLSVKDQTHEPGKKGLQVDVHTGKIIPRKRPEVIKGTTRVVQTGCGSLYVTVNEDDKGMPFEVFNQIGKAGGCAASQSEAIGRLVSLALRCNISPEEIVKHLKGITCHQPSWAKGGKISSCADAIAKAIDSYRMKEQDNGGNGKKGEVAMMIGACPDCGGAIEHEGGCAVCHDCGFTKCG